MQDGPEELIWPADLPPQPGAPGGYTGLPPLPPRAGPDWAEAPTDPRLPVLPQLSTARQWASERPLWPTPAQQEAGHSSVRRWLDRARERQLSVGCGALAALLLLGVCALGAMMNGLPFFGGGVSPTQGVQANPAKPATPLPTSTATRTPTATPTSIPTATSAPTLTATPTTSPAPAPAPTATPLPGPSPTASPAPTATPDPTATPRPAPSPTATPRTTPAR